MSLLEVIALDAVDARHAQAGGADRLEIVADMAADGLSPAERTVAEIRDACDLPLRVMLRLRADFVAAQPEVLAARAAKLAAAGADGFVLGFLTSDSHMDVTAMRRLAERLDRPWTCHRAVDHTADHAAALAAVAGLPGLDQVLTAGHACGLPQGIERVCASAGSAPLMAGGGLALEHLPRLRRAGISAFHIGSGARAGWDRPVDPKRVALWTAALGR